MASIKYVLLPLMVTSALGQQVALEIEAGGSLLDKEAAPPEAPKKLVRRIAKQHKVDLHRGSNHTTDLKDLEPSLAAMAESHVFKASQAYIKMNLALTNEAHHIQEVLDTTVQVIDGLKQSFSNNMLWQVAGFALRLVAPNKMSDLTKYSEGTVHLCREVERAASDMHENLIKEASFLNLGGNLHQMEASLVRSVKSLQDVAHTESVDAKKERQLFAEFEQGNPIIKEGQPGAAEERDLTKEIKTIMSVAHFKGVFEEVAVETHRVEEEAGFLLESMKQDALLETEVTEAALAARIMRNMDRVMDIIQENNAAINQIAKLNADVCQACLESKVLNAMSLGHSQKVLQKCVDRSTSEMKDQETD